MAVQGRHPYGLALSSYLEAFDRAQQLQQLQQLGQVKQASMLHDLTEAQRKRQEEEQVMRDLTTEIGARRAQPALQPNPQIMPAVSPVQGGPDVGPGLPGEPPRSLASMIPQTQPQMPFGASLPPERQAAVLASPRARPVIQGIEEQEKQTERTRLQEEARQIIGVAEEQLKLKDTANGYMSLAKAYTRLGRHNEAGQWHERAIKLLDDKEERERSDKDWEKFLKAEEAYKADPSFTNHLNVTESLAKPESATFRAVRLDLLKNQIKSSVGQDWRLDMLKKKVSEAYSDAWSQGKEINLEQVLKGVQAQNPELLVPVLSETLEKGGKLHDTVVTKLLRINEDIDPKDFKDDTAAAFQFFRAKHGRGPTRDLNELGELIRIRDDLIQKRKAAEQTPGQKELQNLNLEIKKQQAGQIITPLQASLFAQRAASTRKDAEAAGDQELSDQALSMERYWTQQGAELIKKKGGKVKEQGQYPAQKILRTKPWANLADEEKQAVLLDVAKRKLPAKVKTFEDLKALSAKEKQLLNNEITRLEEEAAGERGAAGAGTARD